MEESETCERKPHVHISRDNKIGTGTTDLCYAQYNALSIQSSVYGSILNSTGVCMSQEERGHVSAYLLGWIPLTHPILLEVAETWSKT